MMSTFNAFILLIITLFLYLYWFFKKAHRYFDELGIPNIRPNTFLGNVSDVLLLRKALPVDQLDLYRKLAPHRFAGFYTLHKASIMIRDPELVKNVVNKDFACFQNRGFEINTQIEPLGNHLFSMKGSVWRNLRVKLTNTFTTGKMKMMFPLMVNCAEKLDHVLDTMASIGDEFEIKDVCARYTTDVIGSCAFGIETGSLNDPNSEFRQMGKRVLEFRYQVIIRMLFPSIPPTLIKLFRLQLFPKNVCDYFMSIVSNLVKYREENNVTRYDFLNLLIAMKNNTELEKFKEQHTEDLDKFLEQVGEKYVKSDVEMTVELMAAQCFLFFGAGFETSSSTLSFLILELALNKQIQSKAREEIVKVLKKHSGELTYEALREMSYLDMVLLEGLRKFPPVSSLMRVCTQNYKIPESDVLIKEGMSILVPVFGIHRDPQHYEKPEDFYPEHFTEEAKARRHHYAYLPFGEGPRICIAERFGKMQVKIGLIYFLLNHEYEIASRMKLPVEFVTSFGFLTIKGGVWVKCRRL